MSKEMTVTEMARLGGIAANKKRSKKRRREIATNASHARWNKKKNNVTTEGKLI